jgi:hypothetical protein
MNPNAHGARSKVHREDFSGTAMLISELALVTTRSEVEPIEKLS